MKVDKLQAIFIVAGHGSKTIWNDRTNKYESINDPGATYGSYTERQFIKDIVNKLDLVNNLDFLARNISVYTIGYKESISLNEKILKVNKICAENGYDANNSLLLSIHINAGRGTGLETFSVHEWKPGLDVGNLFIDEMTKTTGLISRGAKYDSNSNLGYLGIVRNTTPLALLIECGFIDYDKDREILINSPEKYSTGILNGIHRYIEQRNGSIPKVGDYRNLAGESVINDISGVSKLFDVSEDKADEIVALMQIIAKRTYNK